MNRLLVDNNIVIDLLAKRQPYYADAARLFSLADLQKVNLSVSALTIANSQYILGKMLTAQESKNILVKFKVLVEVHPLTNKILELALNETQIKDFEDAIQYYTAIESGMECIITRNQKDFRRVKIPVMTALEFLKTSPKFI